MKKLVSLNFLISASRLAVPALVLYVIAVKMPIAAPMDLEMTFLNLGMFSLFGTLLFIASEPLTGE